MFAINITIKNHIFDIKLLVISIFPVIYRLQELLWILWPLDFLAMHDIDWFYYLPFLQLWSLSVLIQFASVFFLWINNIWNLLLKSLHKNSWSWRILHFLMNFESDLGNLWYFLDLKLYLEFPLLLL